MATDIGCTRRVKMSHQEGGQLIIGDSGVVVQTSSGLGVFLKSFVASENR